MTDVPHPARARRVAPSFVGALVLAAAVLAGCGSSDGTRVSTITVTGAWARPTPPGATNGVVYFDVVSPVDDELTAVSVPADSPWLVPCDSPADSLDPALSVLEPALSPTLSSIASTTGVQPSVATSRTGARRLCMAEALARAPAGMAARCNPST